jgi:hypothetical protein
MATVPAQLASYFPPRQDAPESVPAIASIGIPTRDRPESLQRCLSSYIDSSLRHVRRHDYIVIDDSRSSELRRENRKLLQALQQRHGVEIYYAGREEKACYAEALLRQSALPADAVEFGLLNVENCPVATGASRNVLLLHTVGDLLLQIDDDTLCELTATPGSRSGLTLSSQFDPTEFWFLAEGVAPETADVDLLGIHERLLGRGSDGWMSVPDASAGLRWERAGPGFFRKVQTGAARVLVTAAGLLGDSGMGSPLYLLALVGDSRARLLAGEESYRRVLEQQQIFRAVTGATICEGAFCMAPNLGLDNRQLLPPFMPVQRNQDGVFGVLLRTCFPGGFFGFLPWALRHRQPARRPTAGDSWEQATVFRSGQIVQALIRSFSFGPEQTDEARNLRALGEALVEMGSRPLPEFEGVVRLHVEKHRGLIVTQMQSLLQQFGGGPAFWADDVRRVLRGIQLASAKEESFGASDLREACGNEAPGALLQRLVRRFGQLLRYWPEMMEAARDLRARGIRPAVRLEAVSG